MEDTPGSQRPMLGALLTEITTLIGRITLIKKDHLVTVSHHTRKKTRRSPLTQLRKQHRRIILNLQVVQRHQRRRRNKELTLMVSANRVPRAPPLMRNDLAAIDRDRLF